MFKKLFDSLMNNKHKHYSSDDYRKGRDHHGSYGHHHYKRKRKSGSFFSS